jgi:hypothetical protein
MEAGEVARRLQDKPARREDPCDVPFELALPRLRLQTMSTSPRTATIDPVVIQNRVSGDQ